MFQRVGLHRNIKCSRKHTLYIENQKRRFYNYTQLLDDEAKIVKRPTPGAHSVMFPHSYETVVAMSQGGILHGKPEGPAWCTDDYVASFYIELGFTFRYEILDITDC